MIDLLRLLFRVLRISRNRRIVTRCEMGPQPSSTNVLTHVKLSLISRRLGGLGHHGPRPSYIGIGIMLKKLLIVAAATAALVGPAAAATDGTLGSTSTGSFHVGVRLPLLVDITGLTDIHHTFTTAEISAAAAIASYSPVILAEHDFCVYSNNGVDGAYSLTVTGPAGPSGGNENFGLNGPGGSSI